MGSKCMNNFEKVYYAVFTIRGGNNSILMEHGSQYGA
jgi:hypothetical protein